MGNPSTVDLEALAEEQAEETSEPLAPTAPWPSSVASEAFHGVLGAVVKTIEPHTEADSTAVLAQLIVAFGNIVGHEPHFVVEGDRHTMNLDAAIVGSTAKGRKGTSWGRVKSICNALDASWKIQSGLASGEGLTYAVRDEVIKPKPWAKGDSDASEPVMQVVDEGVTDKRLMVVEGEFAQPLRVMAREGNTLSATIRNAWDTGNLGSMTKNNNASATGAHISILGHISKPELLRYFSKTDASNGFGNRFLWICSKRSKTLPEGGSLDEAELAPLVLQLTEAFLFAREAGRVRRSPLAAKVWAAIYADLSEPQPGLFGEMVARAEAQVMRVACIYALADRSKTVRVEHLLAALALWDYAEASARYVFGESLGDPIAERIARALEHARGGMSRTEIRDLFGRHKQGAEVGRALGRLCDLGLARRELEQTGGRPVERWYGTATSASGAESDKSDGTSEFGRIGRIRRSYVERAKAVLKELGVTADVEEVAVDEVAGVPGSNGTTDLELLETF